MRRFGILKRIRRETKGAAAIEFAIIARVVILDEPTAALGVAQTEQVLALVRRLADQGVAVIMISHNLVDVFAVCDQISFILSCDADKLYIDVRAFSSFAGVAFPPPLDAEDNFDNVNMNHFEIGESGNISNGSSIVLVRGFYVWQLFTPVFGQYFANMSGNKRLLSASVAFKNEPF